MNRTERQQIERAAKEMLQRGAAMFANAGIDSVQTHDSQVEIARQEYHEARANWHRAADRPVRAYNRYSALCAVSALQLLEAAPA